MHRNWKYLEAQTQNTSRGINVRRTTGEAASGEFIPPEKATFALVYDENLTHKRGEGGR